MSKKSSQQDSLPLTLHDITFKVPSSLFLVATVGGGGVGGARLEGADGRERGGGPPSGTSWLIFLGEPQSQLILPA